MNAFDHRRLRARIGTCRSVREALMVLRDALGKSEVVGILYGYVVQLRGRARNDYVIAHTGPPEWDESFRAHGGTATDIVAVRVEHVTEPYSLDLSTVEQRMVATSDQRLGYVRMVRKLGVELVWVCPIIGPNLAGYGVLNFLMRSADAAPPLSPAQMLELAAWLHRQFKQGGQLGAAVGLTAKEIEALRELALGQTAADIALAIGITERAVEMRIQSARRKLHASNAVEAVHKAAAYGVVPS